MYVNERTLDYGPDGREAVRDSSTWATRQESSVQKRRVDWV